MLDTPTLRDTLPRDRDGKINLWNGHFFFTQTILSEEAPGIVREGGRATLRAFLDSNTKSEWQMSRGRGPGSEFSVNGYRGVLYTRGIDNNQTIAPTFTMHIPAQDVVNHHDVYLVAGYCPASQYGYLLGWCTWGDLELSAQADSDGGRRIALLDLRPLHLLEESLA